ncbi:MAG TPA: hypothetical protein VNI83_01060, partial [Vicinamibacterales bacterium]|nr:hypothetical protein [Vicinamibacterales bacterium]
MISASPEVIIGLVDEPDAAAQVVRDFPLEENAGLVRSWLLEIRVDRDRARQRDRGQRALLADLEAAVAVPIDPRVGDRLERLVRVGRLRQADARVVAEEPVVHLQDGLSVPGEVVNQARPRHDRVPHDEGLAGDPRRGHRADDVGARGAAGEDLEGHLLLVRDPGAVAIPADAEV